MSLVQNRQYKYAFGQNTYHKVERGEIPFTQLTDPCANAVEYLEKRDRENVGYSFYHMYNDIEDDPREEFMHRHFQPQRREQDIRRRKKYLYGKKSLRNRCCC